MATNRKKSQPVTERLPVTISEEMPAVPASCIDCAHFRMGRVSHHEEGLATGCARRVWNGLNVLTPDDFRRAIQNVQTCGQSEPIVSS